MRLWDKVLTQSQTDIRESLRGLAPRMTVLAIDEIANHFAGSKQMEWGPGDFPYAKPPWNMSFVEWREPSRICSPIGDREGNPSHQYGAVVIHLENEADVSRVREDFVRNENLIGFGDATRQTASVVKLLHTCFGEKVTWPSIDSYWFLDNSGFMLYRVHAGPDIERIINNVGEIQGDRYMDNISFIIALAFTFTNCSNVKLDDATKDMEPPAKIMRRLKLPTVKRYTLNIGGHSTHRRTASGEPAQTGIMPFHLCRGHFATYTEDKPLFGKYTGRFWIPPHTRGTESRGKIEKDYAISQT